MKKLSLLLAIPCLIFFGCSEETTESNPETSTSPETEVKAPPAEVEEPSSAEPVALQFPSLDDLGISALEYKINEESPVILLCHQARFNKAEYAYIAPLLNEKGFNCVAIDQRSGGPIEEAQNETAQRAEEAGKPTEYLDAEQDIVAAIDYVHDKYNQPVILWGSSYSSTLALYHGIENEKVSAVISFSPGNYFAEEKGSLIEMLAGFDKPLFVTSSKEEATELKDLIKEMELAENQVQFEPEGTGYHGSKALWEGQPGGEEYWEAINAFLAGLK